MKIGFVIALSLAAVFLNAAEPWDNFQLPEGANLLKNHIFKPDGKGNFPPWRSQGLTVSRENDLPVLNTDSEGKSGTLTYPGVTLKPGTKYIWAAIMKGEVADGANVRILGFIGDHKYEGGAQFRSGGSAYQRDFDWNVYYREIETPTDCEGKFTMNLVRLTGKAKVTVAAAALVGLGPVAEPKTFSERRKPVVKKEVAPPKAKVELPDMTIEFKDVNPVNPAAHVGEKPAPPPEGCKVENRNGKFVIDYVFTTPQHDAFMFDLAKDIPVCENISFTVSGEGKGHELFIVLYDAGGEAHFAALGALPESGKKTFNLRLGKLLPKVEPFERYASKWGGDGNQTVDLPVKKITLGINDVPDTSMDRGQIVIENLKIGKW